MMLLLGTADAAAARMPLAAAAAAMLLSCCLHAACGGAEEPRAACPMVNVVDEHMRVVTVSVMEVATKPLPSSHLYTFTSTTSTTFTSTTYLTRHLSLETSTVEVSVACQACFPVQHA